MLRRIVGLAIAAPAVLLLGFAAMADVAWFERHVVVPAYRLPPPAWTLPALRLAAAGLRLRLLAVRVAAPPPGTSRGTPRGAARREAASSGRQCGGRRIRQRSSASAGGRRSPTLLASSRGRDACFARAAPPQPPGRPLAAGGP